MHKSAGAYAVFRPRVWGGAGASVKEFRCGGASLNSASPATLSAAFFLPELVHALMGQPEKTRGIARAHLQFSGSQESGRRVEPLGLHGGLLGRLSYEDSRKPGWPSSRQSAVSRRPTKEYFGEESHED